MSACGPSVVDVITCVVHYTIDPDQIAAALGQGIDGFFTDFPGIAVQTLRG